MHFQLEMGLINGINIDLTLTLSGCFVVSFFHSNTIIHRPILVQIHCPQEFCLSSLRVLNLVTQQHTSLLQNRYLIVERLSRDTCP